MQASAIRLLVIGAGRMGRVHIEVARSTASVMVCGIVDPCLDSTAQVADGPAIFDDLDAAIAWGGFDAALVATPSDLHPPTVGVLLRRGVPTLCEKPLGLDVAEASALAELAHETSVPLQVGYWRRFVPALVDLRARIATGEFGSIALVEAWQWDREPPSAEFRQRSGGILRDMGVHEIDQIRWLTGQDIEVQAVVPAAVVSTTAVPDDPESVALLASLSGGGVAYASLGRRHVDGDACWLEVIGTRDAERVDFMRGAEADHVFRTALVAQLEAFAAAARGGLQVGAGAADAVAALAVLESAERSLGHASSATGGEEAR